jgi:hypothetical protein
VFASKWREEGQAEQKSPAPTGQPTTKTLAFSRPVGGATFPLAMQENAPMKHLQLKSTKTTIVARTLHK